MLKHKRLTTLIASLAATASLAALPGSASAAATTSNTITEGLGTPAVQLGMSRSQIQAAFPNSDCFVGAECFAPGDGGYVEIIFSNNTVSALEYTDSSIFRGWYSSTGVTPMSTLEEIATLYGTTVDGDTVHVPSLGYSVQQLNTYICGDTGCQVSGTIHRHFVYGVGGGGGGSTTVAEIQGDITIRNTQRKAFTGSVTIDVNDSAGQRVASRQMTVVIPGRGSVTIDPETILDPSTVDAGTYSWTAKAQVNKKKVRNLASGTFEVVYVQQ